jgi:hypothetical protein
VTSKSKRIGDNAEKGVASYLAATGWPDAEWRRGRGIHDAGDIAGTPRICWQVKGGAYAHAAKDSDVATWVADVERQRIKARAEIGIVAIARKGYGPARASFWWAIMTLPQFLPLVSLPTDYEHPPIQVRLYLRDVVSLLRRAGYGLPLDAAA